MSTPADVNRLVLETVRGIGRRTDDEEVAAQADLPRDVVRAALQALGDGELDVKPHMEAGAVARVEVLGLERNSGSMPE